ncbi:MAG: hypothetical protein DWI28_00065, partial [Planctomycetota bacterium]
RADDSAETVKARLVVYHKDTERMIPYYRDQRNFVRIEGNGEVKGVFWAIEKARETTDTQEAADTQEVADK